MIISSASSTFTIITTMRHTTPVPFHVLSLTGELDLSTAPMLQSAVHAAIGETGPRIILDLRRLTFCDARGLSTLAFAAARCRRQGGWLTLACPSPMLVRILALVDLTSSLQLYPTLGEAIRAHAAANDGRDDGAGRPGI